MIFGIMKDQQTFIVASIIFVLIFIVVAIGGFYTGVIYQKTHSNQFFRMTPGMRYGFMPGGIRGQFPQNMRMSGRNNAQTGVVTAISGNKITIKFANGTSRVITTSSATQYIQSTSASIINIKPGELVSITQQTQNGSPSAQTIRITTL